MTDLTRTLPPTESPRQGAIFLLEIEAFAVIPA